MALLVSGLIFLQNGAAQGAYGDPDTSFGMLQSGNINDMSFPYSPNVVALQPDGKILVAGYRTEAGKNIAVLRRYLQNGWVDTSFGDAGTAVFSSLSHSYGALHNITVLANGKILVSGISSYYVGNDLHHNTLIWRFKTNGVYDATWGETGRVLFRGAGVSLGAYLPAGSSSQKIFVGFRGDSEFRLYRLLSNGSLDPTFDGDGVKTVPLGNASAVLANNALFVAGRSASDLQGISIIKYTVDGTSFPGFGWLGVFSGNPFDAYGCSGYAVNEFRSFAVQSDGRFLAGGYNVNEGQTYVSSLLFRHQPNGAFDTSFNMFPCDGNAYIIEKIKIHTDDTIFYRSTNGIARRTKDGQPDGWFNAPFYVYQVDYLVQPDGKVVLVGRDGDYARLSRHLP